MNGVESLMWELERDPRLSSAFANITIFDAGKIRDVGTFEDPHHYPEGIPFVFVNGQAVVDGGKFTAARPGRVIRRPTRAR